MSSTIPLIEVSHLPSAASLYAVLIQPLGLQFLSASPCESPHTILHYGSPSTKEILFSLTASATATATPQPTTALYLSASSPKAVTDFHKKAQSLTSISSPNPRLEYIKDETAEGKEEDAVIAETNIQGTMIQASYYPSSRAHHQHHHRPRPQPQPLETASTEKEARRVLQWQQDVARSVATEPSTSTSPPPASIRRSDTYPAITPRAPSMLRRRETVTTEAYRRDGSDSATGNGGGMSKGAIIGTLLGAAAGAAVAYAMVRSESPSRESQRQRVPSVHSVISHHPRRAESYMNTRRETETVEHVPARSSWVSTRGRDGQDREDIRPRYVMPRIDERSYVSSRSRSHSEAGSRYERPLAILPGPGSYHSSRHEREGSYHASRYEEREGSYHSSPRSQHSSPRDSYHTARSAHTGTTIKPVGSVHSVPTHFVTATPSKTTIRVGEGRSRVSVRPSQVALPESVVGGRGYAASVAPSDSVSSVGSKRERERLIGRMREREGGRW